MTSTTYLVVVRSGGDAFVAPPSRIVLVLRGGDYRSSRRTNSAFVGSCRGKTELDAQLDGHREKLAEHDVRLVVPGWTAEQACGRFALRIGVVVPAGDMLPEVLR